MSPIRNEDNKQEWVFNIIQVCWRSTGSVYFGTSTESDIGSLVNVIDALKSLTILKIEQVFHFQGSAV